MNLQENISRIKQVMGLVREQIDDLVTKTDFQITNKYNPEVEKLQKFLISKGYNVGKTGKSRDGVDGIYGRLTKAAYQNYKKGISPDSNQTQNSDTSFEKSNADVFFVGGLEKDMNLGSQTNLLSQGFGDGRNVKSFHYYDNDQIINDFINNNPNVIIYLFSAGANKISPISNNPNVDLKKVYIIEPYSASRKVIDKIESAFSKGLPRKNVFHGGNTGRGSAIKGATPSNAKGHFGALTSVASIT
jgi:hypothetical protein